MKLFSRFSVGLFIFTIIISAQTIAQSYSSTNAVETLPTEPAGYSAPDRPDWLIVSSHYKAGIFRTENANEIAMSNGLIRRVFRLLPNAATIAFDNIMLGESVIRGVKPEASVTLDGKEYNIGGLAGQEEYAFLRPEWIDSLTADPASFHFNGFETGPTKERFPWKQNRYSSNLPWPPPGVSLTLNFEPPQGALKGIVISVHYELYDGIPLIAKWFTIKNGGSKPVRIDKFEGEILAAVEYESSVDDIPWQYPNMHVESDYAFLWIQPNANLQTTYWLPDPQFTSQVNFELKSPVLLVSKPPIGPDIDIVPGETFESFRTFELIQDSTDRERKGLAVRKMYRTLAPWVTENPIFMHITYSDQVSVRNAIDQCAETGFEMVIISFGSGLNMENNNAQYINQYKKLADYAHKKKIELGGYSLLASRSVGSEDDVIDPKTMKPGGSIFGNSPCIGSKWGINYFQTMMAFYEKTGFDMLEHDGSYPGDLCASKSHPGHHGLNDSQWTQWKTISDFYKWCRARGIFLNVPAWFFMNGQNKTGMGYREVNWSLPRDRQVILGRQNIFDGTWEKTPSMGWMFVPLTQYHGGGEAATIEPLAKHLDTYEAFMSENFGSGVQACYRGSRLYDTKETKEAVKNWVAFYKRYRPILDSDIIHVRRPDARDIDIILHVNPQLPQKGMAVVFNPLTKTVKRSFKLPLYYTGLKDSANIREQEGTATPYKLDRDYNVMLNVELKPQSMTWFVIE